VVRSVYSKALVGSVVRVSRGDAGEQKAKGRGIVEVRRKGRGNRTSAGGITPAGEDRVARILGDRKAWKWLTTLGRREFLLWERKEINITTKDVLAQGGGITKKSRLKVTKREPRRRKTSGLEEGVAADGRATVLPTPASNAKKGVRRKKGSR